jgi:inositol oxygenase
MSLCVYPDTMLGTATGAQWALGGDTWVVGCKIPDCTVFPEFNDLNPDMKNPELNTEYGIYQPNCGFENLIFAYGHDEYMYHMMVIRQYSKNFRSA